MAELCCDIDNSVQIVNNFDFAEYNYAFYIERPFSRFAISLVENTERNLIVFFE